MFSWHLLRLALRAILDGSFGSLLVCMGVCCSSWIATSRGSTKRSFICPMGCLAYSSVQASNLMVSRSFGLRNYIVYFLHFLGLCSLNNISNKLLQFGYGPPMRYRSMFTGGFDVLSKLRVVLLVMATICMEGVYIIEQPSSSLLMKHDRMVWLLDLLGKLSMRDPFLKSIGYCLYII